MLKNNQRQAAMYIGLGVVIAILLLLAMGRLRTEKYEEVSDDELEGMLEELTEDAPMEDEMEYETAMTGPSADYDSEEEEEEED
jgi:hypothetical protein